MEAVTANAKEKKVRIIAETIKLHENTFKSAQKQSRANIPVNML